MSLIYTAVFDYKICHITIHNVHRLRVFFWGGTVSTVKCWDKHLSRSELRKKLQERQICYKMWFFTTKLQKLFYGENMWIRRITVVQFVVKFDILFLYNTTVSVHKRLEKSVTLWNSWWDFDTKRSEILWIFKTLRSQIFEISQLFKTLRIFDRKTSTVIGCSRASLDDPTFQYIRGFSAWSSSKADATETLEFGRGETAPTAERSAAGTRVPPTTTLDPTPAWSPEPTCVVAAADLADGEDLNRTHANQRQKHYLSLYLSLFVQNQ